MVSSRYFLLGLRLFRSSIARTFETLFLLILALFLTLSRDLQTLQ